MMKHLALADPPLFPTTLTQAGSKITPTPFEILSTDPNWREAKKPAGRSFGHLFCGYADKTAGEALNRRSFSTVLLRMAIALSTSSSTLKRPKEKRRLPRNRSSLRFIARSTCEWSSEPVRQA